MQIRRAVNSDIPRLLDLLSQVLEIHASIRPDIFRSGTTKYSESELREMITDDKRPIYVAADDDNTVRGYAFCIIREPAFTSTMHPNTILYIDDLCVDESFRGHNVGKELFDHIKDEARNMGCYELTLSVWTGNDSAEKFYDKMGMTTKSRTMELIL